MRPLVVIQLLNEILIPENISRDRRGNLICLHMGPVDTGSQIIRSMAPLCLQELIEREKSNKIPLFPFGL